MPVERNRVRGACHISFPLVHVVRFVWRLAEAIVCTQLRRVLVPRSIRGGESNFGAGTDEPFLRHVPTRGERRSSAGGEDLTQLCDFENVFGSENDLPLSPACVRKSSTGRAVTEP